MFFSFLTPQAIRREAHDEAQHAISEYGRGALKHLSRKLLTTSDDRTKAVTRLAIRDAQKMHSWTVEP
jgi:hypothetical protein